MKRKQEILYHFIFWILLILMEQYFQYLFGSHQNDARWLFLQSLGFILLEMLVFYTVYSWIAPNTIPQKRWAQLGLGIIFAIFLFAGIRYLIEEVVIYQLTGYHNYTDNARIFWFYLYDNSYFAFRIVLLSLVFYFVKYLLNHSAQLHQLKLYKKHAELRMLKSQLSPHFLFNTLNSFYADSLEVNSRLSDDILKLSEMLRYVTYENETEFVLLKDELHFLNNYIALFQRRFDDQIYIEKAFPEPNAYKIPALLLIHFVENAFKHGVLDDPKHPVKLDLSLAEDTLNLKLENRLKPGEKYDQEGIGYKNIQQRLQLIFGKDFKLENTEKENQYLVFLQIPLKK